MDRTLSDAWTGFTRFTLVKEKLPKGYIRGVWKGDMFVADIEELESMDASDIHARRLNAKEVSTSL